MKACSCEMSFQPHIFESHFDMFSTACNEERLITWWYRWLSLAKIPCGALIPPVWSLSLHYSCAEPALSWGCPQPQNGTGNKGRQKRNTTSSPAALMGRRLSLRPDFHSIVHMQNAVLLKSDSPYCSKLTKFLGEFTFVTLTLSDLIRSCTSYPSIFWLCSLYKTHL